ncbi:hypothetical protein C7974DRAFT_384760 [Boeremia exigua]|uniref:uncharacterized protein n=1 Tax=Boeremia exigua TaxID=749465 RepID=UPI001E8E42B3|nr:uncharacterized protein C7974DRAFT_384760 [Boeremia exigua]KAH6642058.1 hypothetical protein C7974DRAFT_384760 [Boeremia exigua]
MFGSFTQTEVEVVEACIDELESSEQPNPRIYYEFTRRSPKVPSAEASRGLTVLADDSVVSTSNVSMPTLDEETWQLCAEFSIGPSAPRNFLPLWFTSPTLLETLPSVSVRADAFDSAIVRVLRAQSDFDVEGQGIDEVHRTNEGRSVGVVEIGLEICSRADIQMPTNLQEVVAMCNAHSVAFSRWMRALSMQWLTQRDILIGMSWAFMELHEVVARLDERESLLSPASAAILWGIACQERVGLEICEKILQSNHKKVNCEGGLEAARKTVQTVSPKTWISTKPCRIQKVNFKMVVPM